MKYFSNLKVVLVGLCFMVFGSLQLFRTWQARQWPQKPALMESSKIVAQRYSSDTTYRLDVRYQWEHEGRTYHGTQFGMDGTLVEDSESLLREKAVPWAAGRTVTCWVNPKDPAEAVLSPEDDIETQVVLMTLGTGLFLWGRTFARMGQRHCLLPFHPPSCCRCFCCRWHSERHTMACGEPPPSVSPSLPGSCV